MKMLPRDLFLKFLEENHLMIVAKSNTFLSSDEYFCMPEDEKQREMLLNDIIDCMNGLFFSYENMAMSLRDIFKRYNAIKRNY